MSKKCDYEYYTSQMLKGIDDILSIIEIHPEIYILFNIDLNIIQEINYNTNYNTQQM